MKKTVGFFGGTFDPLHFGHISLALQLLEFHNLDEVLFCPAYCSPFKSSDPPIAAPMHRLEMVRLGIEGIPQFKTTSIEIDREGPSFTIDTLRLLKSDGVQLRLLLSEEAASRFDLWKEANELMRLAPPLIGERRSSPPSPSIANEGLRRGITPTKILEISSTDIRERLRQKLYCGHLVPHRVLAYIDQHRLYK